MPASKKNAAVLCAGTKKRRRGEMSELADAAAAREDERAAARIGEKNSIVFLKTAATQLGLRQ